MTPQQIAKIYDSFPENQRDMPKTEFIKKALATQNPNTNRAILSDMIERKCRAKTAQMEKAVIDSAITRGKK